MSLVFHDTSISYTALYRQNTCIVNPGHGDTAMLTMQDTPDRGPGNSPAELLLGRPLQDMLPLLQPWG